MKRHAALLSIAAASAALLGCATESLGTTPPGSSGGRATIAASSRIWTRIPDAMSPVVTLDSVDGQRTRANTSRVLVAPGHHMLAVTCRYGSLRKTRNMDLDAAAGGYYEIGVAPDRNARSCETAIRELQ